MTITMYQSDRNFVTPANDASLYSALGGDSSGVLNRGDMFKITVSGLTVTIGTGQALILGRLVEITSPVTLTLPSTTNGTIAIVVDLSKNNTVTGTAGQADYNVVVNQVYVSAVTGPLVQDDINNGGFIYELPIGTFSSSSTTASVQQKTPLIRDTGWKDMPLATGASFNPPSNKYARYRVLNGIVTIMFDGVNTAGTAMNREMFKIPDEIMPKITTNQAMLFQVNYFDQQSPDVYPVTAVIAPNHIYARWNSRWISTPSLVHVSGTIVYSLG